MKNLLLALALLVTGHAWAEWVLFSETDTSTFYYDPATIRKDGHIRRVWQLGDLSTRHKDGEMSSRYRVEYDCKQERMKFLGLTTHSEPMASGTVLKTLGESKDWNEVPPRTVLEIIFKIVCAN
jgi:hypothetical protein